MTRARRKAALRAKLAGKVKLETRFVGAACPACGYIYDKGFSAYFASGGDKGSLGGKETLTICTRCRRVLALHRDTGHLRALDETALMLLTAAERAALDDAREMLEVTGYNDLA